MEQKKRIRLDEVTLLRAILAVLIVFMHSFTCYNGSWAHPEGYVDISLYKWLSRISFASTLEAFVFISGYLFAFQRITLNRTKGGITLIINKLKRLILPSVIFSAIYFALFCEYKGAGNTVYAVINGCGHMWYLPMLFWCFLGGWLLEKINIRDSWKMTFLILLNLLNLTTLPLQLSSAFTFIVYFYGGYLIYKHSEKIKSQLSQNNLVLICFVFILLFAILRSLRDVLTPEETTPFFVKALVLMGNHGCQLIYAWSGIFAIYGFAVYYTQRHLLSGTINKFASTCFGIYLIQQFVLELLYYKTSLPIIVGPYWLPWCGFIIALTVSYVLSVLMLKTKTGRFLIG